MNVKTVLVSGGEEVDLETSYSVAFVAPDKIEFGDLSVKKTTRKKLVGFRFSCNVTTNAGQTLSLCSAPSSRAVVTSNEKQWAEALGNILADKLFSHSNVVSVSAVCNRLQAVYLAGTRQHRTDPPRPLSPLDFRFVLAQVLHYDDAAATVVTKPQFDTIWEW
jgi:hypothetical protein